MARKVREINVIHVFKDGLVTTDPKARTVPAEICRQIHDIAEKIRIREALEAASRSTADTEADNKEGVRIIADRRTV